MDGVVGFVLAGIALAGSPGPNTLSLAATGAAFGIRGGIAYLIGLEIGMVAVMAIVASGLVGIVLAVPDAKPVIAIAAAVYFVYLAYRIATAPPLSADQGDRRRPSLIAGIGLSLINVKGYAAMAALFSGFILLPGRLFEDALTKTVIVAAIILAVNIAWLVAGAALTRVFHDPRSNRIINIVFAVVLIASVAAALLA
ncbi:MAG TPA: LysE family translocator [Magnetospirillaceae bacterium]|jgi:threonine/homoserine/homoserine lactone efflux protein